MARRKGESAIDEIRRYQEMVDGEALEQVRRIAYNHSCLEEWGDPLLADAWKNLVYAVDVITTYLERKGEKYEL